MKVYYHLFPPFRWFRSLLLLLQKVRVHENAYILGRAYQLQIGAGTKIGSQVHINPGKQGRIEIDNNVWISTSVEMETNTLLQIREKTTIQRRSTINGTTRIGRSCILAPNVFISSGTHPFREFAHLPIREQEKRMQSTDPLNNALDRPIWVQDDCWLGTNAVICPGVTIGKGSIVGANSVVTHDITPYSVVAGCPARKIGERLHWEPLTCIDPANEHHWPYLIDAKIAQSSNTHLCTIFLTTIDPLTFVLKLSTEAHVIVLGLRQKGPATINVDGKLRDILPEQTTLKIPIKDIKKKGTEIWCSLSLVRGQSVEISKIELK